MSIHGTGQSLWLGMATLGLSTDVQQREPTPQHQAGRTNDCTSQDCKGSTKGGRMDFTALENGLYGVGETASGGKKKERKKRMLSRGSQHAGLSAAELQLLHVTTVGTGVAFRGRRLSPAVPRGLRPGVTLLQPRAAQGQLSRGGAVPGRRTRAPCQGSPTARGNSTGRS